MKKCFTHKWQKFPPHLINVLTLPSENENITFHTFIMYSLNITRCIKLNDWPDGIIHRIEVRWVLWRHVWHYGLSFSNVFMTSMSCDSVYCMCGAAYCWLMTQLTNGKRACVLVYVSVADILNILCDYQFVSSVLDELYVLHHAWFRVIFKECIIKVKCDVFIFTR